jgi:ribose 5-phosphate isomerase B
MHIFLGSDHGGFELKERLKVWLTDQGHQVEDCGAYQFDPSDDYPQFAFSVAEKVMANPDSRGILLCRSGGGMVIAANKVKGCRAMAVWSVASAKHAATNDGAQIISLSGDWVKSEEVEPMIAAYLETPLVNAERHQRRIDQIMSYEESRA